MQFVSNIPQNYIHFRITEKKQLLFQPFIIQQFFYSFVDIQVKHSLVCFTK